MAFLSLSEWHSCIFVISRHKYYILKLTFFAKSNVWRKWSHVPHLLNFIRQLRYLFIFFCAQHAKIPPEKFLSKVITGKKNSHVWYCDPRNPVVIQRIRTCKHTTFTLMFFRDASLSPCKFVWFRQSLYLHNKLPRFSCRIFLVYWVCIARTGHFL